MTLETGADHPALVLPRSRKEAKAAGLRTYFTPYCCGSGHEGVRRVSDGACVGCLRGARTAALEAARAAKQRTLDAARQAKKAARERVRAAAANARRAAKGAATRAANRASVALVDYTGNAADLPPWEG